MKKILFLLTTFLCLSFTNAVAQVTAVDDTYTMVYTGFGLSFYTPLTANDTYSGTPTVQLLTTIRGITLSGAGITVQGYVQPGVYVLTYQICDNAVPQNCDTATVTIIITTVQTNSDFYTTMSGVTQVLSPSVLSNDTVNSVQATSGNTNMSLLTTVTGITMNVSTGVITVASTVAPGVYTITYQLCDTVAGSTNCNTGTVTITVGANINAVNDEKIFEYTTGTVAIGNIYTGDTYGSSAASLSNTTFTILTSLPTGLSHDSNGNFTATNLAVGNYAIQYKLCDNNYSGNCDTAILNILVTTNDTPFPQSDIRANNTVKVSGIQPGTNRIIIAGDFTSYGGVSADRLACLKSDDLTIDGTFNLQGPDDVNDFIKDFAILPTGEIIVVGRLSGFNGIIQGRGIMKLPANGYPIPNYFNTTGPGAGFGINVASQINSIAIQSTGHIIIVGDFTTYNGALSRKVARLSPTGEIDLNFDPGNSFNGTPFTVAVLPDDTILVGGAFTTFDGAAAPGITRLDNTGNIVAGFNPGLGIGGAGNYINDILVRGSDIYIGGVFGYYYATNIIRKNIAKITSTGAPVTAFNPQQGFSGEVRTLAFQQTPTPLVDDIGASNLYVGGDFTYYQTFPVPRIACLNSTTAAKNPQFDPGAGPNGNVYTLTVEQNLKVILGGAFTFYNNTNSQRVTRIFPGYLGTGNIQGRINQHMDDETIASSISIYPNPSEGLFNIDFKSYDEQKFDITIHNSLGQLIYQGVVTPENTNQIDLTRFESGSYFITLLNAKETINKIVIKK